MSAQKWRLAVKKRKMRESMRVVDAVRCYTQRRVCLRTTNDTRYRRQGTYRSPVANAFDALRREGASLVEQEPHCVRSAWTEKDVENGTD